MGTGWWNENVCVSLLLEDVSLDRADMTQVAQDGTVTLKY